MITNLKQKDIDIVAGGFIPFGGKLPLLICKFFKNIAIPVAIKILEDLLKGGPQNPQLQ